MLHGVKENGGELVREVMQSDHASNSSVVMWFKGVVCHFLYTPLSILKNLDVSGTLNLQKVIAGSRQSLSSLRKPRTPLCLGLLVLNNSRSTLQL
jgi:hypothetical protein